VPAQSGPRKATEGHEAIFFWRTRPVLRLQRTGTHP